MVSLAVCFNGNNKLHTVLYSSFHLQQEPCMPPSVKLQNKEIKLTIRFSHSKIVKYKFCIAVLQY